MGPPRGRLTRRAGQAGFLAAVVMLGAQLTWRVNGEVAAPAFPEVVVAAVARLTPLEVFAAATETYGSLAKRALFVAVLLGTAAVGALAGTLAGRLTRRTGSDLRGRLAAAGAVAAGLLLLTALVLLPTAHLGLFAADSRYAGEIRRQLILTFGLFALAWALLVPAVPDRTALDRRGREPRLSRRVLLDRLGWDLATLAALATVGATTWRLIRPRAAGDIAADRAAAGAIADAAASPASPVATPGRVVGAGTSAPAALAAELARLEAEGRLTPRLTATADFYHVSKNLQDPEVRAAGWALSVSGLVAGARAYPLAELTARATTRKITTLCCISNELNGDLIGTAEWLGFPLADLLAEVGVQPEAVDVVLRCADDYADSIPLARALDPDTLVVVGMNGQPLAPDHGYPARLIVPGIYGMKNVKWLESIELVAEDFKGYWQTRGWSDPAPNQIWARIDTPSHRERVAAGPMTIAGVASAGDHGIARVEVSLDGGRSWAAAALEPALNPPLTWVRWALAVAARPGDLKLRVRVTDGAGTTAPEDEQPPLPDGATGWPRRTVEVEG